MIGRRLVTYSPFLVTLMLVLGLIPINIVHADGKVLNMGSDVAQFLFELVVGFLGFFTGWAAEFLNFAVNQFVINFGGNVTGTGIGAAIDTMWSVVRDFFNIIFIFSIIYIGFKMILGSDESGSRRALVYLIIAALLVNFSLFISKFVVDFSNILAREVAVAGFPAAEINGNPIEGEVDIGTNFFNYMLIPTTLDSNPEVTTNETTEWGYIFGIAMVYVVAIFSFAAGALMLMIRYAALCIFMVLSPLMFIGWVLPQFKNTMNKYWSGFLGRAFFAPAYIVLLYFSGAVIQASFSTENESSIGKALTGGANGSELVGGTLAMGFGPFILSAIFLIMAVQVASKLSTDGANTAMRVGGNLARGGRRFAARNTVGLGAYGVSWAGRGAGKAVDRFDAASNSSRGRRVARGALNTVTFGATSHTALKGATGAMAGASVAGSRTREQYLKDERTRKNVRDRIASRDSDEADIEAAEGIDRNRTDLTEEENAILNKAEAAANRYSQTELEEMSEKKRNALVKHLKATTVGKLLESDNLSAAEKKALGGEYEKLILDQVTENGQVVTEQLTKLSKVQMKVLGDEFVADYAAFFSEKQMEEYTKDDSVSERQKEFVKGKRKSMLSAIAKGDEISLPIYGAAGKKTYMGQVVSENFLFAETKRTRTKDGFKTASHFDDKGNLNKLKSSEVGARPFSSFVKDGQLRENAKEHITADVLKQIARSANQGKPTMSPEERTELAVLLLEDDNITPAVANYLTNKKGQEDFLIDVTESTAKKVKEQAANNKITDGILGM